MSQASHTTRPCRGSLGFTLLEMMVALIAGAVLVAPLYVVLRGMSQTSSAMRDGLEARQRARVGINVLQRDLARVGLSVSPDPQVDGRSASQNAAGSFAQFRRALVHLNPDRVGNDSLLLSGNFRGGRTYRAVANGSNLTIFSDAVQNTQSITEVECRSQFDPTISAFAHVVGGKGKEIDARVTFSGWVAGTCTVTLNGVDTPAATLSDVYNSGDTVWVSANQTVLYMVEPVTDHLGMPAGQLVRYFVAYDGSVAPTPASCQVTGAAVALPGGDTRILATRQVIADYVENFQVWLRVVAATPTIANNTQAYVPHYTGPVTTAAAANLDDGVKPLDENHIIPANAADSVANYQDSLGCATLPARGVQHARSALVLLSVRTERTDASLDWTQYSAIPRVGYRAAPVSAAAPTGIEKTNAAYRVETFVTEVPLPNLAGRRDLLRAP